MPIETSPIPFKQLQLPYTPLFDPTANPEIAPNGSMLGAGSGMGMDMGMGNGMNPLSHGPASVAASAIIGPSPGGVAGPHHAIPALPDAGYTAPTMRAASLAAYAQGRAHPGSLVGGMGGEGSVYAGGSLYGGAEQYPGGGGGGGHHHQGPSQLGTVYSDGWSASLPAPRRAPIVPPPLQPRQHHHVQPHHQHHQDGERGREPDRSPYSAGHHHYHHHHHSPHRDDQGDFDDGTSDASYYAMPRRHAHAQHHRSSSQGSSASDLSSPEGRRGDGKDKGNLHRRTLPSNHQAGAHGHVGHGDRHRSPSTSAPGSPGDHHHHSPISPSPLRDREEDGRRGPRTGRRSSLGLDDEGALGLDGLDLDRHHRERRTSHASEGRSPSQGHVRPGMIRQRSNLRQIQGSVSDSEETRSRRESVRKRSTSRVRRRSKDDGDGSEGDEDGRHSPERGRRGDGDGRDGREGQGRSRRVASIRRPHRDSGNADREEGESPYHRPHLPVDHSPLLSPHAALDYGEHGHQSSRTRRESQNEHQHRSSEHHQHQHRHHSQAAHSQAGYDDRADLHEHHHHQRHGHGHRRANSEQGLMPHHQHREYTPPPHAGTLYPAHSASLAGGYDDYPQSQHPYHHQHPEYEHQQQQQHQHQHQHPISAGSRRNPDGYGGKQPFPVQADGAQSVQPLMHQQHMGMGMGSMGMGMAAPGPGPGPGFDDGASAAGTAMTFMDGQMGGRVSQYGLPKYAHNPKVDYRRFCVQRGNADVFID